MLPQHDPVAKISEAKAASHKMQQHMHQEIKALPSRIVCIDLNALTIYKAAVLIAFLLQIFYILIQMLFLKAFRPRCMNFHHFLLLRGQNHMVVGMPFFRQMKSIGAQNLHCPFSVLFMGHKQVNIRCLPKFRNRIKPCNGAALQRDRCDVRFPQQPGQFFRECLQLEALMDSFGGFPFHGRPQRRGKFNVFQNCFQQRKNLMSVRKGQYLRPLLFGQGGERMDAVRWPQTQAEAVQQSRFCYFHC